jgi:hypothetical protein
MTVRLPGAGLLSASAISFTRVALVRIDPKGMQRVLKRRRRNERRYWRAFRWNTYVRPLLALVGRVFGGR